MVSACFISRRRLLGLLFLAIGLGVSGLSASPSGEVFSADAVKAAYLVNFIRFIEWPSLPPGDNAPFVIGVSGNRELEDYLWKVTEGKLLHDRKVRILRLVTPSDATDCQLIYINPTPSRAEAVHLSAEECLQAVRGKPILTVSQDDDFLRKGGIINFYTDGKNLRFEIAQDVATAVGLQPSSKLLALARIVHTDPPAAHP
jgi:hypothetical protein